MKKRKGILIMILLILLIPLLLYIGINAYALSFASGRLHTLEEGKGSVGKADAILVLGAGVRKNGTPSNMLEDRLLTAVALFEAGVSDRVLVSGDHGREDYDEVGVMKRYLIERGIPSECIFMDHAGFSTYDSLYRAGAVFGAERLVIVTQRYHAYRSLMIGDRLGIHCEAVAAPILVAKVDAYPKQNWYSFRESVARVKDFFYCIGKPQPRFLGDPISLKGSGDVTNDGKW